MYFPYFRGKMYDLAAVAELSEDIADSGKMCPIVEPVNVDTSTQNKIGKFAETGMPFLLITNPHVGGLTKTPYDVKACLIDKYLAECDTCIPAFIIDANTSQADITSFFLLYPDRDIAVIYDTEPTDKNFISAVVNNANIIYHLFFDYRTKRQLRSLVPLDKKVIIGDWFDKQDRNADYPVESEFSDQYLVIPNSDYSHFGDFSIIGRAYSDSGGPPYAVALHHIYAKATSGNALWVRHFVSDRTDSAVDPGGKFLEALTKLITTLPTLGAHNLTPVRDAYQALYAASRYPGLGVAKKLAIKHHLYLMLKLLSCAWVKALCPCPKICCGASFRKGTPIFCCAMRIQAPARKMWSCCSIPRVIST